MLRRRTFLSAAAGSLAGLLLSADKPIAGTAPMKSRALLGINNPVSDLTPVNGQLHQLEADFGIRFPWASVYWNLDTALNPANHQPIVNDFAASHRGLHVCLQPEKFGTVIKLTDVTAGVYDADLLKMFNFLHAYGLPVVVRWGHEFNGHWYPWSAAYEAYHPEQAGCKSPAEWIAAWQHVVGLERSLAGTSNIRWYWCANRSDSHLPNSTVRITMEEYWPDPAWVDIVGCDGYNNNENGQNWRTFDELFVSPYSRISAVNGTKPFWIGEVGCVEPKARQVKNGVLLSKADWLAQMFNSTIMADPVRPLAVHYFNYPNTSAGDRRFSTSAGAYSTAGSLYRSAINANPLTHGYGVLPPA